MAISAAIKFVQGGNIGTAGVALLGVLTTSVVASNGPDTPEIVNWKWKIVSVPAGSAIPVGVVSNGPLATYTFAPDVYGGYHFELEVTDLAGNKKLDRRVFLVPEPSGRKIPPFDAEYGALNFAGGTKGWDPLVARFLKTIEGEPPLVNAATGTLVDIASIDANGECVYAVRLTGAVPTLTGAGNPYDGRRLFVYSLNAMTVANESASSTAANRIKTCTGSNVVIGADSIFLLVYDGASARWKMVATSGGSPSGASGEVQTNNGSGGFAALTNVKGGNGFLSISVGGTLPAAGRLRAEGGSATIVAAYDSAADRALVATDNSGNGYYGSTSSGANQVGVVVLWGASRVDFNVAVGGKRAQIDTTAFSVLDGIAIALGTTNPASAGDLRTRSIVTFKRRNNANSGDMTMLQTDTSDQMWIGSTSTNTEPIPGVIFNPSSLTSFSINNQTKGYFDANGLSMFNRIHFGDSLWIDFGNTNPATAGDCRFRSAFSQKARNNANSGNVTIADFASDILWIGDNSANTESCVTTNVRANNNVNLGVQGASYVHLDSASLQSRVPIQGGDGSNLTASPYGVHSLVVKAFPADTNYVVLATEYAFDKLKFNVGSWTVGRTVTFPHPSTDAGSYSKWIWNTTAFTMTISTGTGSTKTLTSGSAERFLFSSAGVNHESLTVTP